MPNRGIRRAERYRIPPEEFRNAAPGERAAFTGYFRKVVALDPGQRVYDAICINFPRPIPVLLHNRFAFNPFWRHHNGIGR